MEGRMKGRERARKRGFNKEREFSRRLWNMGFATVRAPASGSKARLVVQPDVVAAKGGRIFCFEVKTRRRGPFYIGEEQVRKLCEWAKRAGAKPFIAIYTKRRWFLVPLEAIEKIEEGYRIGKEQLEGALDLKDLDEIVSS